MEHDVKLNGAFRSNSAYRDFFKSYSSECFKESKKIADSVKGKARGINGIISPSYLFMGNSLQKTEFRGNKCNKPKQGKGASPTLKSPDWRCSLRSTYQESYTNPIFNLPTKKNT